MEQVKNLASLTAFFNEKVDRYNRPSFIAADPICVPHLFSKKQDIEIAVATEQAPENWRVVFDGKTGEETGEAAVKFEGQKARYLRVSGKGRTLMIGELKVESDQ